MERLRCAECRNVLSLPIREVALPTPPDPSILSHHRPNPPLLRPRTYAVDEAEHGRDCVVGTIVLSPGDVRGTRFVNERVITGCWSLVSWSPCMACEACGALVAARTDDCCVPQETRFHPDMVVWETCEDGPDEDSDSLRLSGPFTSMADWDEEAPDTGRHVPGPVPARSRPELVATRWRARGLKSELYRDDPPA